jgi:hypothetical protein
MLMGLRWHIPLPGPFSVGGTVRGQRRTVWTHPGCYVQHPTEVAANAHAAALAARTTAQVRRANIGGLAIGGTMAGAFVACIVTFFIFVVH